MYFGLKGQSVPLQFSCLLPAQKLPSYLLRLGSVMEAGRLGLKAERRVTRSNWTDLFWSNFSRPQPPIGLSLNWVLLCIPPSNDYQRCLPYIQRSSQFRYAAKHPTLLWLLILRQPMWSDHTGWNPFFYLFYLILFLPELSALRLCFELQVGLQMLIS